MLSSGCVRRPLPILGMMGLLIPAIGFTQIGVAHAVSPSLEFSSYWGSGTGLNRSVSVDRAGNVYLASGTSEADWPTTLGPPHSGTGKPDVAVAKFDGAGRLMWSRLLGGPDEDYAYVSAVNDQGELYVAGRAGTGFPTTPGAFDRSFNGGVGDGTHDPSDGFVAKLSTDGQLIYSTYIGGNGDDVGRAIHLLPSNKVIVAGGNTTSTDLPVDKGTLPGPVLKSARGGGKDAYVAIVAADGSSLDFCTYFGPSDDRIPQGDEEIRGLGLDRDGNIWIGGTTHGSDMTPTADAFQKVRGSPRDTGEAYVAKLSVDGRHLLYFSWIGGNGSDDIETESVSDTAGNFYVAGGTASSDFPTTPGAFQSSLKGGGGGPFAGDGWVAKIANDGTLAFATLYGGSTVGPEAFFGPVVDAAGNVYCTGRFRSTDCVVTNDAFQKENNGDQDAVLAVFSPDGTRLLYGSYFGGTGAEHGRHIGIHPDGSAVYIVGETNSTDLPLINAPQRAISQVFWAKFALAMDTPPPTLQPTMTTTQPPVLSPTRTGSATTTRSPTAFNPTVTPTRSAAATPTSSVPPLAATVTPTSTVSRPAGTATATSATSMSATPTSMSATPTSAMSPLPASVTPTDAPEHTPTVSPAASPPPTASPRFCGAHGPTLAAITVADIITGVNITLDRLPLTACPAIDFNRDGVVRISELVTAVSAMLRGSTPAS